MRRIRAALCALTLALAAAAAHAADNTAGPESLYAQGEFEAAIAAGEGQGDGGGFAIAARAALAEAELRDTPCLPCLERAEALARNAIMADAENAEAYIYLVVAIGRRARLIGFFQAQRERIGAQADGAIEAALARDPDYPWALAARGGWHIEVVRLAGRILGNFLFGASVDEGRVFFRRAIAGEPQNLVIPYQFALSLSAYDLAGARGEIAETLRHTLSIAPHDVYETAIGARAAALLAELDAGDDANFRRLLAIYRGNP